MILLMERTGRVVVGPPTTPPTSSPDSVKMDCERQLEAIRHAFLDGGTGADGRGGPRFDSPRARTFRRCPAPGRRWSSQHQPGSGGGLGEGIRIDWISSALRNLKVVEIMEDRRGQRHLLGESE